MPSISPWLPVLLAGWLAAGAGCAVLPIAIERGMPSTTVALNGMEEAQDLLADSWTHYENNFAAIATRPPVAAHGATHAAYQRWVDDEVRELPDPQESIIIAGGDN